MGRCVNVFDVAEELAALLDDITGLRVYPFPPDALVTPCAIIGYPDTIDFDLTLKRGGDSMVLPVYLVVDRNWDRATAEQFAGFTDSAGTSSIKQKIESATPTDYGAARVRSVTFSVISVAGLEYWVATFLVDIYGSGS